MIMLSLFTACTVENSGKTLYVSKTGDDITGDGSESSPYSTITKALQESGIGTSIRVGPGIYGENIIAKGGVQIIGTGTAWATDGSCSTVIDGLGTAGSVVELETGCSISNFQIRNGAYGVRIEQVNAGVGACEITGTTTAAVYILEDNNTAANYLIAGNRIDPGNTGVGIRVQSGAAGLAFPKIQLNEITGCGGYGVEILDYAEADLGGGIKDSQGGNTFQANGTGVDVYNGNVNSTPVDAQNNYWDGSDVASVEANDVNDPALVLVDPLGP